MSDDTEHTTAFNEENIWREEKVKPIDLDSFAITCRPTARPFHESCSGPSQAFLSYVSQHLAVNA